MLIPTSPLSDWQSALASYDKAITAHPKTSKRRSALKDLDDFARLELPKKVADRVNDTDAKGGYMIKEEICKIVEWKITVCLLGFGTDCTS